MSYSRIVTPQISKDANATQRTDIAAESNNNWRARGVAAGDGVWPERLARTTSDAW